MSLKNKLNWSKLKTIKNGEDRDLFLLENTLLYQFDLDRIRKIPDKKKRIEAAARTLYEASVNNKDIPEGDESAQITAGSIAMIVQPEWSDLKKHENAVSGLLRKMAGTKEYMSLADLNNQRLDITPTHLLHQKVGAYSGNLFSAAEKYNGFVASRSDLTNSIRIPTELGFDEYLLFGVLWSAGTVGKNGKTLSRIGISSDSVEDENSEGFEFYKNLAERFKEVFNLKIIPKIEERPARKAIDDLEYKGDKRYNFSSSTYLTPRMDISSKAIATWLIEDIGYSRSNRKNRGAKTILPEFKNDEQKLGFLVGSLAVRANLHFRNFEKTGKSYLAVEIVSSDDDYKKGIVRLTEELGYKAKISGDKIIFRDENMFKEFLANDYFIHPTHQRVISEHYKIR